MNAKHTPGPWHIEVTHVTEGAYTISHGANRQGDGPECDVGKFYCSGANARLIAAAPDLLEALQKAVRFGGLFPDLKEEAEAAIAKAKGE